MGRRTTDLADFSEFDYLIDLELESICECGHRDPEHSASGQCHGCEACTEAADVADQNDDHAYARCGCTQFQVAVGADVEPTVTLAS